MPHQKQEAIKRRAAGNETLENIGRSYNVSAATISGSRRDRCCSSDLPSTVRFGSGVCCLASGIPMP